MKIGFIYILLIVVVVACNTTENHKVPVVDGLILNSSAKKIFLFKNGETSYLIDTININEEGNFRVYKESIDSAGFYTLELGNNKNINLFLKPNDFIQLQLDATNVEASCNSKNSKIMNAFWDIERNNKQFQDELNNFSNSYKELIGKEDVDSLYFNLKMQKDSLINIYRNKSLEIIKNVDDEVVTWFMLNQKAGNVSLFNLEKDLKLFLSNSEKLVSNKQIGNLFSEYDKNLMKVYSLIRSSERFSPGNEFIKLKARTNWNDSLPLTKLNAKLINIVLWSTNNDISGIRFRQLNSIHKKYSSKGLKTLFVAYEKDKDLWKEEIGKLNSSYWHIIDTSAVESTDLIELGIRSFPTNFLVEPNGKIIDRNIWGNALEKRVSIFLKNN